MKSKSIDCSLTADTSLAYKKKLASCQARVSELEQFSQDKIEGELRAKSILDAAVDGIVIISEKGVIQSFNPAAEKIFGYKQAEVTGQKVNILMPEPHSSHHDNYIQRYLSTGQRKIIGIGRETMARRKDGSTFPVELSVSEVMINEQRIFTGVIKDITERRRSASALNTSEERFRLLVETMNDGLAVQDAQGKIIYVNPRFCSILGYDEQCLIGRLVTELMDTGSRIVLQSELDGNSTDGLVELKMEKDNGEALHVHVSAKAIRSPDGEYKGSFVVVADVTQIKKLQHQLLHSQKMEAIGHLAGGIAHDFNNLLTVIRGYTDLARLELRQTDPVYNNITQIDGAAKRAEKLTRQLLAFGRKQMMRLAVVSINHTISNIENMMQRLLGEEIQLMTNLGQETGHIKADENQIEQVILNIAVNARDAMPNGGRLALDTSNIYIEDEMMGLDVDIPSGPYVLLSICDTGIGMDRKTLARIFEPFFTTKEKGHGTGLGLSTAYGIVKQSSGDIRVYSEPGKGTCFKIYLPRLEASPDAELVADTAQAPARGGHETILVVEDEESVREFVVTALQRCGYHVISAPDGPTALKEISGKESRIDLILTDVVMPHMNGKEFVQRFKKRSADVKVLYMSGYTDDAIVCQGVLAPGTPFIGKPFTLEALTRKIREMLPGSKHDP